MEAPLPGVATEVTRPVGAVVALKKLATAKSRMAAAPTPLRERLARCMALDTMAALVTVIDHVLVISDQPDLSDTLSRWAIPAQVAPEPPPEDPRSGLPAESEPALNRAYDHGDRHLRGAGFATVLACMGDLPALRADVLRAVLTAAAAHPRTFVDDRDGSGTTMLIGQRTALDPRFGSCVLDGRTISSAERHRGSGAIRLEITDLARARLDVDTADDLAAAHHLGLGPATASLVDPRTGRLGRLTELDVIKAGPQMIMLGDNERQFAVPWSCYDGDPARVQPGRRLYAVDVAGAWSVWT
ncbi:MAG: 2-phospho-L-lactate guanylyltransferase [Microlunatus sp.]|nr:2-phospho-L-lactate guanylyltransferase [Microlunatus sp.]MDN5770084.1 2-phospho-L-lactate guanylyltransferase [Microlunatus sp.]